MKIASLLVLTLLVAACGSTELSQEDLSQARSGGKAVVKTNNRPIWAEMIFGDKPVVQIIAVDGRKIASQLLSLDEQIALDVGTHHIEFNCVDRAGYNEKDFEEVITLELKPHHEYLIGCSFDSHFGRDGTYVGGFEISERPIE